MDNNSESYNYSSLFEENGIISQNQGYENDENSKGSNISLLKRKTNRISLQSTLPNTKGKGNFKECENYNFSDEKYYFSDENYYDSLNMNKNNDYIICEVESIIIYGIEKIEKSKCDREIQTERPYNSDED